MLTDGRNRITINLLWLQKVQQSLTHKMKIHCWTAARNEYSTLVIKYLLLVDGGGGRLARRWRRKKCIKVKWNKNPISNATASTFYFQFAKCQVCYKSEVCIRFRENTYTFDIDLNVPLNNNNNTTINRTHPYKHESVSGVCLLGCCVDPTIYKIAHI